MSVRYVFIAVFAVIVLAVILLSCALWSVWRICLHVTDKKAVAELRVFGFRKKILDTSANTNTTSTAKKTEETNSSDSKKAKKNSIIDKLKSDGAKVYDSESGLKLSELRAVFHEYKDIFERYKDIILDFFGDLRYKIDIPILRAELDIGLDNPAYTGIAYSSVWGAVGIIYPILSRYMHIVYPTISVTPDLYGKRFRLEIESIIKVRPAHIINALVKQGLRAGITYFTKIKKGSVQNG